MDHRRTRGALVMLALAALSFASPMAAPEARAAGSDSPGDTAEGWKKVLAYARCAFDVFRAVTPVDWASAGFECTRLFLAEPPLTPGGE